MSNRKYPRLAEGYHDRSQYHPYQTGSKYSKSHSNCVSDGRDRSPTSGSGSRGSSPYVTKHSSNSPRFHRSKSNHSRSRESSRKGSSKSPSDSVTNTHQSNNSHSTEHSNKLNRVNNDFPWSQHTSSSGKVYYYNCKTEKSQWEKPKEWIEREKRERERKEREKELVLSREPKSSNGGREFGYTTRDADFPRTVSAAKLSRPAPSKSQKEHQSQNDGRERQPDAHQIDSRTHGYTDNSKKEYRSSPSTVYISDGRGHSVVKTTSANTVALTTTSYRTGPVAASLAGDTTVSPASSLQDVSPPSTPSSHPGSLEPLSHSSSPQLLTASPLVAQFQASQSPHLPLSQNQIAQYNSRPQSIPVQNVYSQTVASNSHVTTPTQFSPVSQQGFIHQRQQLAGSIRQTSLVNTSLQQQQQHPMSYTSNSVPVVSTSSQPAQPMFENQVRQQPVLHPLQQATLLQQSQMLSETQHHKQVTGNNFQQYSTVSHPSAVSGSVVHQLREAEQSPRSTSTSPQGFPFASAAKDPHTLSLPPITNSQPASGPGLQASSQPSPPVVNLQALVKYTDKSFTNPASSWPSELIEKQAQRCWEDSTNYLSESTKTTSDHLETQSQLAFMELRLSVGTRRISHLKDMTKTLEVMLEDSDAKSLM